MMFSGILVSRAIDIPPVRASTCASSAFGEEDTLITQNNNNQHFPSKYLRSDGGCFCSDMKWKPHVRLGAWQWNKGRKIPIAASTDFAPHRMDGAAAQRVYKLLRLNRQES